MYFLFLFLCIYIFFQEGAASGEGSQEVDDELGSPRLNKAIGGGGETDGGGAGGSVNAEV